MRKIINKNFILYFLIFICLKPAFAKENFTLLSVEADKSIEYFEKQKVYIASGNAKASKGNFSIKAEKITAFLGETKNSNITDIEAIGNVIIINKNTTAKSSFATYNFKNKLIFLKGNNQYIESKTFRLTSKKNISFDDINKIASSEGDVKLFLSGPISIFARKISANFDKINNNLTSAYALGDVKIKTKSETITSSSAKYDNNTNIISLQGDVIIKRSKSELTGEKGYMNLKTGKSKIESSKTKRVKGIFKPVSK